MSGTNPGAWPDMEWVEPVKKTVAPISPPKPVVQYYTAAEMKAARVETVIQCYNAVAELHFVKRQFNRSVRAALEAIDKLKEEIENEDGR